MYEFSLELIKIILGFGSNLLLLAIAALIARYTVSNYQKAKDSNSIREKLIDLFSDIFTHSPKISTLMRELQFVWEDDDIYKKLSAEREILIEKSEFRRKTIVLTSRMSTQLILRPEQGKIVNGYLSKVQEFTDQIYDLIDKGDIQMDIGEFEELENSIIDLEKKIFAIILDAKTKIH